MPPRASVLAEEGLTCSPTSPPRSPSALAVRRRPRTSHDAEDEELRRELLVRMTEARGNMSEVARAMGKARQQVQRWVRRFGIDPEAFREK